MDKSSLFSIGDISKIFHLSPGSLRHYETLGILIPEYVDPETNYRYYSARQFEILNTVRYLRALDMPLPQIADFFRNRDIDVIEDKLLIQKQQVIQKKKELENIEKKINNRLHQITDAKNSELDTIREIICPPIRIIRFSGSLKLRSQDEIEASVGMLSEKEDEPVVFLGKVGFGISEKNLLSADYDKYDYIFLVVEDEDKYSGKVETIPEEPCVSVRFRGSHGEAALQYRRLTDYMKSKNLKIAGASREITLIDYGITNDTEKFLTEITIPVKK